MTNVIEPDLFDSLPESTLQPFTGKGGYAYTPGSGPEGKKCKHCDNFERWNYNDKTYFKCELTVHTNGAGSDIRANAAACMMFNEKISNSG